MIFIVCDDEEFDAATTHVKPTSSLIVVLPVDGLVRDISIGVSAKSRPVVPTPPVEDAPDDLTFDCIVNE